MNNFFIKYLIEIKDHPIISLLIIGNIFLIESILSIDNITLLATMVLKLKKNDRKKAIKYGIFGAYFFRFIGLLFTSILIKIWWLKPLGGLYLIFISLNYFFFQKKYKKIKHQKSHSFWKILISIELMDLIFSIDNIVSAISFSNNFILIFLGVFIGILFIRFLSKSFIYLIEIYPFLKNSAFYVILLLGFKLIISSFKEKNIININIINIILDNYFYFITIIIFILSISISFFCKKLN
ncbi:TerC family protein [Blattabacterium cuenoti]|uniref:TerC family protein n=1 Tax=Blattabacterium cuenoti TaxID=1653831 RepID=UPI00163C89C8|nr:DUF475 domain-containing protein [Blattabacterium cuenoti]